MPFKDPARRSHTKRMCRRERDHPNYRQVYIDNGGKCQALLNDDDICGSIDALELHAPMGERANGNHKQGDPKMPLRTLICTFCHPYIEDDAHKFCDSNRFMSRLAEDIAVEQAYCGGFQAWLKKYNLIDRYQPYTVKINKER